MRKNITTLATTATQSEFASYLGEKPERKGQIGTDPIWHNTHDGEEHHDEKNRQNTQPTMSKNDRSFTIVQDTTAD
jgi:hypothetical protein